MEQRGAGESLTSVTWLIEQIKNTNLVVKVGVWFLYDLTLI